jgi:hypothetical protein
MFLGVQMSRKKLLIMLICCVSWFTFQASAAQMYKLSEGLNLIGKGLYEFSDSNTFKLIALAANIFIISSFVKEIICNIRARCSKNNVSNLPSKVVVKEIIRDNGLKSDINLIKKKLDAIQSYLQIPGTFNVTNLNK